MFNVIKHKNIFIGFSLILIVAAIIAILVFGFRPGIDFTGGTLWQFRFNGDSATVPALEDFFRASAGLESASINTDSDQKIFLLRTNEMNESDHQRISVLLEASFPGMEELRFESIGPTIGSELRHKAVLAFILVLVGISLYIAFAFRKVFEPVSSWKYGFVTLITLFHDALIPAGLFSVLGYWKGIELDSNFIVALLVIMGFSVHDTIVVFDRIRENLSIQKNKNKGLPEIINASVNQTFARSINTSLTLILVLLALYFLGSATLEYFVLIILIGTVIGTYSSIFIASPLLTFFTKK